MSTILSTPMAKEMHEVRLVVDMRQVRQNFPEITDLQSCVRTDIRNVIVRIEGDDTIVASGAVTVVRDGFYVCVSSQEDPRMNAVLRITPSLIASLMIDGDEKMQS